MPLHIKQTVIDN